MKSRTLWSSLTFAILLVLLVPGLWATVSGDYTVTVTGGAIGVNLSGDLVQAVPNISANNTAASFGTLPVFRFHLEGGNSSLLSRGLNDALGQKSPGVSSSDIVLDAYSNGTLYHYALNFNVLGASANRGDVDVVDLSWRSFVISSDIKVENRSLNAVLPTYLLNSIALRAQLPANSGPPLVIQRFWYLNNIDVNHLAVVSTAQNLIMFNFTALSKSLQSWSTAPDVVSRSIRYSAEAGFNLTYIERAVEPEGSTNFARDAVYKMSSTIAVPWNAVVSRDTAILDSSVNIGTLLMTGSIVSSLGLLSITIILERRLRAPQRSQKARKPK